MIYFKYIQLLALLLTSFLSSSIFSQTLLESGYSGFLFRLQLGYGYSELVEDYINVHEEEKDPKYYGKGYFAASQIGWAVEPSYAVHLNGSLFIANDTSGPEIQPRTSETITATKHSFSITSVGIGFTWYHIASAFWISPEFNLYQYGTRNSSQKFYNNPDNDEYTLTEQKITYHSRAGYGVTFGKDFWFHENMGVGFALLVSQNHLLSERNNTKITTQPSGTERDNSEIDLNRVSARNLFVGLSANIIIN